jgi:hypothetical protein
VAWQDYTTHPDRTEEHHVRAYDLDRHRLARDALLDDPGNCQSPPEVYGVVVSPEGDVAWTTEISGGCGSPDHHLVTAWDACGRIELDDDPYLNVYSLRRVGRTVVWEVGGEQRSFEFRSASEC